MTPPKLGMVLVRLAVIAAQPGAAIAHRDGLDKYGCHHDRKRGGYDCHRAGYIPCPALPNGSPAKPKNSPPSAAPSIPPGSGEARTARPNRDQKDPYIACGIIGEPAERPACYDRLSKARRIVERLKAGDS